MNIFENDYIGSFVKRPNRFIIYALLDGVEVKCHCPNTGRMGELLIPGVKLILEKSRTKGRKTDYSVVAVFKGELIVPITSARANDVARELIIPKLFNEPSIRSEVTYGKSRFDFLVTDGNYKTFIEVKSCTLFQDEMAIFPDAPTDRGRKHLNELIDAVKEGYRGMVIFVVFNHLSQSFSPNRITDPKFSQTLELASSSVDVIPYKVRVDESGRVSTVENPVIPVNY